MTIALLVLGLILFVGLVVVHEWGHFVAARRGGVEVEEFGIGFPPKIWAKKIKTEKSKFIFTINLLPLGGFVRLKGENDADKRPGSFGAAPMGTKIKIMLAGVVMNAVVAFVLLTILALTAMPKIIDHQFSVASDKKVTKEVKDKDVVLISNIVGGSPAEKAGIKSNDRILKINGTSITAPEQIAPINKTNAGKQIEIILQRAGQEKTVSAQLNAQDSGNGFLGISSKSGKSGIELQRYTWSAPIVAGGFMAQITELTFKGLGTAISSLFKGDTAKASEQVSGPVGIFYILKEGGKLGVSFILMIIAIISLTLALINALPIPALDGGRLFVTLLFKAINQPLTKPREEFIHGTGFVLLMFLFVLITIVDVKRFF